MIHGGKTPRGKESVHFKHGRWSRHLPTRLAEKYQEGLEDERLTQLRDDISMLDARIAELQEGIEDGESGARWLALGAGWGKFMSAFKKGDVPRMEQAIRIVDDIMTNGVSDTQTWAEITALLEQRRKLTETENKREFQAQQFVSVKEIAIILGILVDIINRHVSDTPTRRLIYGELDTYILHRSGVSMDKATVLDQPELTG